MASPVANHFCGAGNSSQFLHSISHVMSPDLYSQKKGRTFAAYLMLEAADGKAAFRLEFPKKKNKTFPQRLREGQA